MAHTYEELKKKTIEDLREIAKGLEHDAVKGYTQMNKEHLLPAICKALGIDVPQAPAPRGGGDRQGEGEGADARAEGREGRRPSRRATPPG